MTTATATKPDYLGLLNTISLAESRAGKYLTAWAAVTPDPELKQALSFVAGRETSHGVVFCQLIERLGHCLQERDEPKFAEQLRIYGDPSVADAEKIRYGRYGREEGAIEKFFSTIDDRVHDERVDALTRDTLRWYVHEERDSTDVLQKAYDCIEGVASEPVGGTTTVSADAEALMACMTHGFTSLQQSLKELTEALAKTSKSR